MREKSELDESKALYFDLARPYLLGMTTTRYELSGDKKTVRLVRETSTGFVVLWARPIEQVSASTYAAVKSQM